MSELKLETAKYGRMTISARLEGEGLYLTLSGIGDSFAVKGLGAFLQSAMDELGRLDLGQVAVDVSGVSLLNSSCIKQFITFLRPIKAGEKSCRVNFVVAADVPWQRRSMSALVRMCPRWVSLSSDGSEESRKPSRKISCAQPLSAPVPVE